MNRRRIALTFKDGGENGGPYISHKRIQESRLKDKYDFVPLIIPRARKLISLNSMRKFVGIIRNSKVEVVQIAGLQLDGVLVMMACKMAKVKTIVTVHGRMLESPSIKGFWRLLYNILEIWTVNNANLVFGVSDYVSSWKICKKSPNYYGTIYNLPPEKMDRELIKRDKIRVSLNIRETDILFVSTGRIVKEKGYDILWKAIQKVDKNLPVKYLILGNGSYLEHWKREVYKNGYEDKVIFLGYQKNVDKYLAVSDAFIICTKHETLCISLIEAAMHELPLIGTNVGGIPEIINKENGILVNNEDVQGFADAINKIASNRILRLAYGKNAVDYISKKFNKNIILHKLEEVYRKVLEDENI